LVLVCGIHRGSKFHGSPQNEVRISQELPTNENDVRFAFFQVTISLFAVED